jgi:hypothetical protein
MYRYYFWFKRSGLIEIDSIDYAFPKYYETFIMYDRIICKYRVKIKPNVQTQEKK